MEDLPFAEWLVEEATAAGNVKYDAPVMVVMGNPPYSGQSANNGKWIKELLHSKRGNYFELDGKSLGERNPKWLNDDYVKFIRFAQWRIEQTGYGVLAFITNHGYLDNPTFRGMRQSLMQTFDDIYVLDLHGNAKKKERSPDGSNDKNVFDIQQGVAIGIFVKRERKPNISRLANVYHAHLWGEREVFEKVGNEQRLVGGKYHWLMENDIRTTEWTKVEPQFPFYLFVPQDAVMQNEYEQGWGVRSVFPINNTGVITSRDKFVVGYLENEVVDRVQDFRNTKFEEGKSKYALGDVRERTLLESWNMLRKMENLGRYMTLLLYRPFDTRYLFHHHSLVRWPVYEVMRHMTQGNNVGLVSARSNKSQHPDHFFCSKLVTETKCGESTTQSYLFPLYLYPDLKQKKLLDTQEPSVAPGGRHPNLSPAFVAAFSEKLKLHFIQDSKGDLQSEYGPEDVFHYMYAIFHALTYRARYSEFLKIDFPRLPLTSNTDLFRVLCKLGERLVALHLMEAYSKTVSVTFPIDGNHMVEKVEYQEPSDKNGQRESEHGRVYINKTQYFDNVPLEVWEFHVGGYQVCHKWLKDRKGRTLSFDDIKHYQRIVAALQETIQLMTEIDETIEMAGGWPIE